MADGIEFIEGFEGDSASYVWEAMNLTRSSDHARSGSYGIGKTGLGLSRAESPVWSPLPSMIVGMAFRNRESVLDSDNNFLEFRRPGDVALFRMGLNAQKAIYVDSGNTTATIARRAYSSRTLDDNAWYYIEVCVAMDATAGQITVQLNGPEGPVGSTGAEIIEVTCPTGDPAANFGGFNQFHVGTLSGVLNAERDFSFDDFYVRSGSEGFLGDHAVINFGLEDDRAVDFVRSSGSKNYEMVDETTPDDDTTYNETDEDGSEDIFEVGDTAFEGTIKAVQVVVRARKTQTQIWTIEPLIDLAGDTDYGPAYYVPFPNYETLPPAVFGTAPGGLAWTVARLNAIGVGYRAQSPLAGS